MKANRFLEKITSDLPAKIFCFVIALFLYLFYQLSLVDKKTIVIPLKVVQEGSVVSVDDVPSSVRVTIRSNSARSNLITADAIRATVNLNYLSENGTFDIPIFLDVDKELLAIDPFELRAKPEYVTVKVEKKIKKAIRIETPVVGEVARGYSISEIKTSPDSVYISGPESIVNNTVAILTDTVDVLDAVTNMRFNVNLIKDNKMISYDEEDSYDVEVVVDPIEIERNFINQKVNVMNLSEEFQIDGDIPPIDLKLAGRMTVLENYNFSDNAIFIDLRNMTEEGEYEIPVRVHLPAYMRVVDKSFDNVKVNVIKKEIIDEENEENPNQ